MSLVSLRNISLGFGNPILFTDVNFQIEKGERICLIGRNGTGKSSLLKIIAGIIEPDEGEVALAKDTKIAYLPQEVPAVLSGNIKSIVLSGLGEAGEKIKIYEHLSEIESSEKEIDEAFHWIEENHAWHLSAEADALISKMNADPNLPFSSLSAGMKRRVLLARELVAKPNLLILDEPTNHLDILAIEWLESFLLSWNGAILFVSHDRKFLKKIATRLLDLEKGILTSWDCDYETYLKRREELNQAVASNEAEFDKLLSKEEAWLRQGVKARRCRNEGRVRELLKLREIRRERRSSIGNVKAQVYNTESSGAKVITVDKVTHHWGNKTIIHDFSNVIMRGDRIGIVGPNGVGKTTLLKILIGEIQPDSGKVELGTNLKIAYFDQLRTQLDDSKTLIENITEDGSDKVVIGGQARHVISYLNDFLFTTDRAKSKVSMLSGGEKNRLLLAKIFQKPANLLILDEPTNDLDLETLDLLEEVISKFDGTVLIVSHDRDFLDNTTNSCLIFEKEGEIREFVGDYETWKLELQKDLQKPDPGVKKNIVKPPKIDNRPRKLSFKETKELESILIKIDELEAEQAELNKKVSDPNFYRNGEDVKKTNERIQALEKELSDAMERWTVLESIKAGNIV